MSHACPSDRPPETPTPAPATDRDAAGHFAPGNPGGPGNPYARQVARLRSALLAAVTEEDIQAIIRMQVTKARMGDKEATKLVLQYVIGKPGPAANPDTVDLDEWKIQQACPSPQELKDGLNRVPAIVAVALHRGYTVMHVQQFHDQLDAMDDADRAAAAPSPNGETNQPEPPRSRPRRTKADGAAARGPAPVADRRRPKGATATAVSPAAAPTPNGLSSPTPTGITEPAAEAVMATAAGQLGGGTCGKSAPRQPRGPARQQTGASAPARSPNGNARARRGQARQRPAG